MLVACSMLSHYLNQCWLWFNLLTTISLGAWTWTAYPSTGIYGNNIDVYPPGLYSIEQCQDICQRTPGCYGFDYSPQSVGSCYTSSLAGKIIKLSMSNNFLWLSWHRNSIQLSFVCMALFVKSCTVFSIRRLYDFLELCSILATLYSLSFRDCIERFIGKNFLWLKSYI